MWKDFLFLLFSLLISNAPGSVVAFETFLQHCPSGKECKVLWKACLSNVYLASDKQTLFEHIEEWLPYLPTRSYFKLAMEKGICYLIGSIYQDKYYYTKLFWKQDDQLMRGIFSDIPDDAWDEDEKGFFEHFRTTFIAGLKSENGWDLNRRLYFAHSWDRSKSIGTITKATHYRTLNLLDSNDRVAVREFKTLQQEMSKMHGYEQYNIVEATLVYNEILTESFGRYNVILNHRHQELPTLFKKDWRKDVQKKYKESVYVKYNAVPTQQYQSADNKDSSEKGVPVILMVHGTTEKAAYSIVKAGFGTVSSLDAGYYGQGIYFTRSIKYACSYDTGGTKEKTIILSLVTPGNVFPVKPTDKLRGQPIKPGYQSHYTLVDRKGRPVTEDEVTSAVYDELVVGQDTQAVARYILRVAPKEQRKKRVNKKKPKKGDKKTKKGENTPSKAQVSELAGHGSDDDASDDEDNFHAHNRKLWAAHDMDSTGTNYVRLEQELQEANLEVDKLKKSNENIKKLHEELQQTNTKQQQAIDNLKQENVILKRNANHHQQANVNLSQSVNTLKQDNIKLSKTVTSLQERNAILLAKIAQLESTNK